MSTPPVHEEQAVPIFKAVSSSARQLFQLLNTIRFATKVQVQISTEGIRFAVEESRVMQGIVFLDKALFTTFNCTLPESNPEENEEEDAPSNDLPVFQISLSALLETLQIFGAADATSRFSRPENEGYNSNIRPNRQKCIQQSSFRNGGRSPFSIILEEAGVTTTCNLNTYEPEDSEEIPFQRNAMQVKIITQARWLFDAIQELNNMTPTRLDILALPSNPYFSLSASGHLGSASVDFSKGRELLETFTVKERWFQSYRFDMVKAAGDAMRLASKVSICAIHSREEDEDGENSQEDEDDEFGEGGDDA
ncbi:DNA repair exonuclease Rad1 [Botrytis cinerea]